MRKIDVSIVVPIYNKEKYIDKCVKSLINQTWENIEIILVDDGSTDGSGEIVDRFAQSDERIRAVHQKNAGEGAARNTGINQAQGKYLLFVDADDYIDNSTVEILLGEFDSDCVNCIIFEYYIVGENGEARVCAHVGQTMSWDTGTTEFSYAFLGKEYRYIGTSACNKMFRTQDVIDNGLRFTDLKIGADTIFCYEYGRLRGKWKRVGIPLYYYVQNQGSVMHTINPSFVVNMKKLMEAYQDFAQRHHIENELQPAIQGENVRDIFTLCKYYESVSQSFGESRKLIKQMMKDNYYQNKIAGADLSNIHFNYQVVYWLFRFKMSVAMCLLIKMYHLIFKL